MDGAATAAAPEPRERTSANDVDASGVGAVRSTDAPRRWPLVVTASTVTVAVAIALLGSTSGDTETPSTPGGTTSADVPEEPTWSGPDEPPATTLTSATGAVLVTEDGGTGVRVVDVDTGASFTRRIEEQRPGDQPYRLWAVGSWLVVGWGEIWAVSPDDPPEARLLGEASYFVPSAEPDELWLIDRPDRRGGSEPPTWTLVDHAGTPLHRVEGEAGFEVERGVPGGLAVRGEDRVLRRYERATGEVTHLVGEADARILDVGRDLLLWCDVDCATLQVDVGGRTVRLGEDDVVGFLGGWVAGDGTTVAAHAAVETADGARDFELRIYDLTDATLVSRIAVQLGEAHAAWTPDGGQFLFRIAAEHGPSTFGRYTASGFEMADRDPLEGSRPVPFLVGHASWYPDLFSGAGRDER